MTKVVTEKQSQGQYKTMPREIFYWPLLYK